MGVGNENVQLLNRTGPDEKGKSCHADMMAFVEGEEVGLIDETRKKKLLNVIEFVEAVRSDVCMWVSMYGCLYKSNNLITVVFRGNMSLLISNIVCGLSCLTDPSAGVKFSSSSKTRASF